jgi:dynein heavy chain
MFDHIRVTDNMATHLVRKDGSALALLAPVKLEGSLPEFVRNIEAQEQASVKADMANAIECGQKYTNQHPDSILTAEDFHFTKMVEDAINNGSLNEAKEKLQANFLKLTKESRHDANLKKFEQDVLSSKITQTYRWMCLVDTLCGDKHVASVQDGRWTKNLRTYFENGQVIHRINEFSMAHGGKLQGDSVRLVVTPLTEQAYAFFVDTYAQYRTTQVCGPAGTGKTETIKDLAKILGQQCVVINCSD